MVECPLVIWKLVVYEMKSNNEAVSNRIQCAVCRMIYIYMCVCVF